MIKEQDVWERYGDRFVAVLDIAGFKSFLNNNSGTPDNVYNLLYQLKTICKDYESFATYNGEELLYAVTISDTVILITKDDRPDLFLSFLVIINQFFYKTFRYNRPMTGAIVYGNICVDRENVIIFGEAYQKAYLLQDSMDFYGVICDQSIENFIVGLTAEQNKACDDLLFRTNSYIKEQTPEDRLNLRWHRIVNDIPPVDGVIGDYYERSDLRFEALISQLQSEIESDDFIDKTKKINRIKSRISHTQELVAIMDPFDPDILEND